MDVTLQERLAGGRLVVLLTEDLELHLDGGDLRREGRGFGLQRRDGLLRTGDAAKRREQHSGGRQKGRTDRETSGSARHTLRAASSGVEHHWLTARDKTLAGLRTIQPRYRRPPARCKKTRPGLVLRRRRWRPATVRLPYGVSEGGWATVRQKGTTWARGGPSRRTGSALNTIDGRDACAVRRPLGGADAACRRELPDLGASRGALDP